jgi:hypothetical protein
MRFRTWSSGDISIVYPEARSSIRFERLREGIQDFEKMRILRQDSDKAALIDVLLPAFTSGTRDEGWNQRLNDARNALNEMAR